MNARPVTHQEHPPVSESHLSPLRAAVCFALLLCAAPQVNAADKLNPGRLIIDNKSGQTVRVTIHYYDDKDGARVRGPLHYTFKPNERAAINRSGVPVITGKVGVSFKNDHGSKSWVLTNKSGPLAVTIKPTDLATPTASGSFGPVGDVLIENKTGRDITLVLSYYHDAAGKHAPSNVSWSIRKGARTYITMKGKRLRASKFSYAVKTEAGSAPWFSTNKKGGDLHVVLSAKQLPKGTTPKPPAPAHGGLAVKNVSGQTLRVRLVRYRDPAGKTVAGPKTVWSVKDDGLLVFAIAGKPIRGSHAEIELTSKAAGPGSSVTLEGSGAKTIVVSSALAPKSLDDFIKQMKKEDAAKTSSKPVARDLYVHNDTVYEIGFILRGYVGADGKRAEVNDLWTLKPGGKGYPMVNKKRVTASRADYAIRTIHGDTLFYMTNFQTPRYNLRVSKTDTARPHPLSHSDIAGLQAKAKQGDAAAKGWIAELYAHGLGGFPQDLGKAAILSREAAAAGDPRGLYRYASCYRYGQGGVKEDPVKALALFKQASAKGNIAATSEVGAMHHFGLGVPKSWENASTWYLRAGKRGHYYAQFQLGLRAFAGKGKDKDWPAAFGWFSKAADQGDGNSMNSVAVMYQNGMGVEKNRLVARSWFARAAAIGAPFAAKNLKKLTATMGKEWQGPIAANEARAWFQKQDADGLRDREMLWYTIKPSMRKQATP